MVLTPATATVAAGATQQLTAQGKMSDGSTAAVAVTWCRHRRDGVHQRALQGGDHGGDVSRHRGAAGRDQGRYQRDHGDGDGERAGPGAAAGGNGTADPSALPAASGQLKNVAAYTALNVRGMAAGGSYTDPVTGVRVWKMTSASVP